MALLALMTELPAVLDAQLQQDADLTLYEYLVLSVLSMSPERTRRMTFLAELTSSSVSRLSHVLTRLERRGYIERTRCPGQPGRATNVTLTANGMAKVSAAAPGHVHKVRTTLVDHLTIAQLDTLADIGREILPRLGSTRFLDTDTPPEIIELLNGPPDHAEPAAQL